MTSPCHREEIRRRGRPCWRCNGARGGTAVRDKAEGLRLHSTMPTSAWPERDASGVVRVPDDIGHQKEKGSRHWVALTLHTTHSKQNIKLGQKASAKF